MANNKLLIVYNGKAGQKAIPYIIEGKFEVSGDMQIFTTDQQPIWVNKINVCDMCVVTKTGKSQDYCHICPNKRVY